MGLQMTAKVVCDKCNVNQVVLDNVDAPMPENWLKAQGYANINGSSPSSAAVTGYYCPTCTTAHGTKSLYKEAADLCEDLTAPAAQ